MRKRERFFLTFLFFLILSIVLFFVAKAPGFENVRGALEGITKPVQKITFSLTQFPESFSDKEKDQLRKEVASLQKKIVDQKQLEQEIQALKDQFQTNNPKSEMLLPAKILGMPRFIPGVSAPSIAILDAGEENEVKVGQAVIFKDNVIGKVTKVSKHLSVATLITDKSLSFAGKTANGILGVVKGEGSDVVLENVLTSEELKADEMVVTKGDINEDGIGYPPSLVVGKITSVDKTQSNLFQMAKLKSLVDFSALSTVFIITGYTP